MYISIIPLIIMLLGVVLYFAADGSKPSGGKIQEVGRAMMWVGLFFLVGAMDGQGVKLP